MIYSINKSSWIAVVLGFNGVLFYFGLYSTMNKKTVGINGEWFIISKLGSCPSLSKLGSFAAIKSTGPF
jgi:hypothetical protein